MPESLFDFIILLLNNPTLIGVYIVLFTVITSAFINLLTALINNHFQNQKEQNKRIQDIYSGCIKNLATVSTLSHATEENLDNIEQSLIEAKKYLSLLLISYKKYNSVDSIEKLAELFYLGNYQTLVQENSDDELISYKYGYILDERKKYLVSAADIMLKIIIQNAHKDKRFSL